MNKHDREIMRDVKRRWARKCELGELFCFLCGKKIENMKDCTADHWQPLFLGGKTTRENLKPACKECNNRKGSLSPEEFIAHKEDILTGNYNRKTKTAKTKKFIKTKEVKINDQNKDLYEIGAFVFFIEKDSKKPEIQKGIVLGTIVEENVLYVLVKTHFTDENGKIASKLLTAIPLTAKQAEAFNKYLKILSLNTITKETQR